MNTQALMAGLAALVLSGSAAAQAIPFFNVQYETTTIALTSDGPAGFNTQSGLLGPDPVTTQADSQGLVDIATAGAIVGQGLLSTSVDVSASGVSSAVATAQFTGAFVNSGPVSLNIDFSGSNFASGSGGAGTTLFVSLTSNGVSLFSDYVQGLWQFSYTAPVGTTSLLDLTLASDASAAFLGATPGNASAFGLVTITGAVPEASTWLLFSLGLGGVVLARSRAQAQRSRHALAA